MRGKRGLVASPASDLVATPSIKQKTTENNPRVILCAVHWYFIEIIQVLHTFERFVLYDRQTARKIFKLTLYPQGVTFDWLWKGHVCSKGSFRKSPAMFLELWHLFLCASFFVETTSISSRKQVLSAPNEVWDAVFLSRSFYWTFILMFAGR